MIKYLTLLLMAFTTLSGEDFFSPDTLFIEGEYLESETLKTADRIFNINAKGSFYLEEFEGGEGYTESIVIYPALRSHTSECFLIKDGEFRIYINTRINKDDEDEITGFFTIAYREDIYDEVKKDTVYVNVKMEKTDISYKAKPSLNPFRCTPIEETSSIFINSLISSDYNDFVVDSVSINNDTLRKNFLYQVRTRAGDLIQWEETLPKSINLSNNILYLKTEIISTLSEYNLEITYHTNYGDLTKTHEAFKSRPPKLTVSAGGSYFDTQVGIIDTIKKVGIRLCGDSEYILKDWEIIGEWTKDSIWFEREHSVNFRFIKNFGYNVGEILLSPKEDGFKKGRIILTFLDLETNEEYKVYSNIRSFVDPVLSAEQDEINQQFNLYPNPSNGVFSVKTDNNIYNLSVYNSNGVRVYNQFPYSGEKINFENISNGLYLIQLKNAIKTINKKLIIRK